MKILHTADWHLDSPIAARSDSLRRALLSIPGRIAAVCREENCDLVLLAGDLFDGPCTADSLQALRRALEEMAVPVFITPGNHDYAAPWLTEVWPANVHIFTENRITWVDLPELACRIYGAGYTDMDCPALLEGFHAENGQPHTIGILHADPTVLTSPYCPVTQAQVKGSGLDYLALGHIHKGGSFTAGNTLCAWPGCPMGRGYDEQGEKGLLIVTLEDTVSTRFVPLDTPRFYDLETQAGEDPAAAVSAALPAAGSFDYYRITLTGPSAPVDLAALSGRFSNYPNLELRDRTTAPVDIWAALGQDSFEGTYFDLLHDALETADEAKRQQILLAARISRQLLDGQEVILP